MGNLGGGSCSAHCGESRGGHVQLTVGNLGGGVMFSSLWGIWGGGHVQLVVRNLGGVMFSSLHEESGGQRLEILLNYSLC